MKRIVFSLGSTLLLLSSLALAQPDAANGGKAQNPNNINMGPGGPGGRGGRMNLTPAQREQLAAQAAQIQELTQRQTLTLGGITDLKVQDAVIAFLKEQEKARLALQQKWQQVSQAIRGNDVTDTTLVMQLNGFRDALDDEKVRREKALTALDAQIGFSKNPRLDANLMLLGITGDQTAYLTGIMNLNIGNRGGGIGGQGGPGMGGGMGGGPGGQGGPGGGMGGGPGGQGGPGGDMGGGMGGPPPPDMG